MEKTKIDPTEFYNVVDIERLGGFPGARSRPAITRVIEADRKGKNILKSTKSGVKTGVRYHVYGENLLRFIEQLKKGNV